MNQPVFVNENLNPISVRINNLFKIRVFLGHVFEKIQLTKIFNLPKHSNPNHVYENSLLYHVVDEIGNVSNSMSEVRFEF